MFVALPFSHETFSTFADNRKLLQMNALDVDIQITKVAEFLLAVFTLVRHFSGMCSFMGSKVSCLAKAHSTKFTNVGFLA